MKLNIVPTSRFKKDLKKAVKRGLDVDELTKVIDALAEGQQLLPKYRDHELSGNFKGFRECHIQSDWLLIYKIYENQLILLLERTGTHSDLFKL